MRLIKLKNVIIISTLTKSSCLRVSFYTSSGCRQCIKFKSLFDKMKTTYPTVEFETIPVVPENMDRVKRNNVRRIPLFIFEEGTDCEDRVTCVPRNYNKIESMYESYLSSDYNFKHEHLIASKMCMGMYEQDKFKYDLRIEKNNVFVCFRGTNNLADWKRNLNLNMGKYPIDSGNMFHLGFLSEWLSVKQDIISKLDDVITNEKDVIDSVIFTGHSSGGCISAISVYDIHKIIKKKYGLNSKVVTFGSPMFANKEFRSYVDSHLDYTRFKLSGDIVPNLPILFDQYVNVGNGVYLQNNCRASKSDTYILVNHGMKCYTESLESISTSSRL